MQLKGKDKKKTPKNKKIKTKNIGKKNKEMANEIREKG